MIYNIQMLRALAALSVVFFHFDLTKGVIGAFGVDLFFVISGYIMTYICANNSKYFFLRRVIRIVPIYWLFTVGIFIIALIAPSLLNSTEANWENLFKSLFFIPYTKESGLMQPMLLIGWTLNYEMFFYLTISACLLIMTPKWAPIATAGILMIVIFSIKQSGCQTDICTFYSKLIMLEFCMGVLAYHLCNLSMVKNIKASFWLMLAFISLFVLVIVDANSRYGLDRAFVSGIPAFSFVVAAVCLESKSFMKMKKPIVDIGNASYIIYLGHFYVIQFFNKVVNPILDISMNKYAFALLNIVIIIMFSLILHRYFEKPLITYLKARVVRTSIKT